MSIRTATLNRSDSMRLSSRKEFWNGVSRLGKLQIPGLNPTRVHRLLGLLLTRRKDIYKGRLKEGLWFHGGYRDFDTRMWVEDPAWNRGLVAAICRRLEQKPGAFVDVGTNLGVVAALTSVASRNTRVIAIEASPTTAEMARLTFQANSLSNCKLVQRAVGDREGELELRSSAFHSGTASLAPRRQRRTDQVTKVKVTPLDTLMEELNVGPISVIKIDVEGFEPEVLKGAMTVIQAHLPTIILEFNAATKARGFDFDGVFGPLRSLGYSFSWLESEENEGFSLVPELERRPEMTSEDVVCLPPSL